MFEYPQVSIIIPCYNEQDTIHLLLDALHEQSYPSARMEVIIADGMSTDGTRRVIRAWQQAHLDLQVQLVDNQRRIIPAALNRALEAASGEIIVRLDAHSLPRPDYVSRCVEALDAGKGDNVGGVWEIQPGGSGWLARSIAVAAAHPLGVGDARYRYAAQAAEVDTVPFGAFRRDLIQRIGPYDEGLLSNEDYEFNVRIRQDGGRVWLDPQIRAIYFARPSLRALMRQYWRYGYWKLRMLRRYPETLRWRQALPPVFVLGLVSLLVVGFWLPVLHWLLFFTLLLYTGVLLGAGLERAVRRADAALFVGVPLAIMCMHFCWGGAFLWSLITLPFNPSTSKIPGNVIKTG